MTAMGGYSSAFAVALAPSTYELGEQGSQMRSCKLFCTDESGQDMVEYSLLMAFVCLASAAMFISVGKSVASIWGTANKSLSQAYSAANAQS